ncbi:hypothetical protein UCMB321_5185 [Pseudomonas batumici]|uniref:Uncharacterized protein n=1 Tax=Pseudomonas batumici TaxID=226910 RepID=A0A0C2I6X3_9PSED|nr:hypothetical protein UCMB321_5185 [Pseudomonas batumici]
MQGSRFSHAASWAQVSWKHNRCGGYLHPGVRRRQGELILSAYVRVGLRALVSSRHEQNSPFKPDRGPR